MENVSCSSQGGLQSEARSYRMGPHLRQMIERMERQQNLQVVILTLPCPWLSTKSILHKSAFFPKKKKMRREEEEAATALAAIVVAAPRGLLGCLPETMSIFLSCSSEFPNSQVLFSLLRDCCSLKFVLWILMFECHSSLMQQTLKRNFCTWAL